MTTLHQKSCVSKLLGRCRHQTRPRPRHRATKAQYSTTRSSGSESIETRHLLADGVGLEMLVQKAAQENFLPYIASKGYDCYAVSMRGQGNSDPVFTSVAGTLERHADDLADLVDALKRPPILVTHSIAGLIGQRYILRMTDGKSAGFPKLAGAAFLCSVPPSGNKNLIGRFLRRDFFGSLKITWGFVGKSFIKSIDDCRDLFFSKDIPQDKLRRYQQFLAQNGGNVRLMDLQDINKQVPLPSPPPHHPPAFVLGAENDTVVDVEAVQELAEYYGVKPVILPNMAHDCMLDTRWEQAADALVAWLDTVPAVPAN